MLDLKFVRANPDIVIEALAKRGGKISLDSFLSLEEERRSILAEVEEKKARWWLLAVLLHGLTDFQLVIGNLAVVEGLLAIEAVAVLLLVVRFVRREERS